MIGLALVVLVVIAHPDDETLFSAFIHSLTQKVQAKVDLLCLSNGEGGFRHSAPAEFLYGNLRLSDETIARQFLPRIRQEELLNSGKILGIRKHFFYNQGDLQYTTDVDAVFARQWNKTFLSESLERTLKEGNGNAGYDLMLLMLPNRASHGHHTASALIALETIERMKKRNDATLKIPTVLGGSEFVLTEPLIPFNSLSKVEEKSFRFDRRWKLNSNNALLDYQLIVLWACAAHKSQGGLIPQTLSSLARDYEEYFYFSINDDAERLESIEILFDELTRLHQQQRNERKRRGGEKRKI